MKDEVKDELTKMRARLIELRDAALTPPGFDPTMAVGLSHAIRSLAFTIDGREPEDAP